MGFPKGRRILPFGRPLSKLGFDGRNKMSRSTTRPLLFPQTPIHLERLYSANRAAGATGFDVGCETLGACRVVGNSLNCLQTYSCKRRQLRSDVLIPPNLRPIC